jgi:hypothetical protein
LEPGVELQGEGEEQGLELEQGQELELAPVELALELLRLLGGLVQRQLAAELG